MTVSANSSEVVNESEVQYAGFNIRLLANLTDMLLIILLTLPFLFFGPKPSGNIQLPQGTPPEVVQILNDYSAGKINDQEFSQKMAHSGFLEKVIIPRILFYNFIIFVVLGAVFIFLWKKWGSTPGKMLFRLRVVDDITFQKASLMQYLFRYVGYLICAIPLFFGFLIMMLNKRKKGLHDYMAGTVVIYGKPLSPVWEHRKRKWRVVAAMILLVLAIIIIGQKL